MFVYRQLITFRAQVRKVSVLTTLCSAKPWPSRTHSRSDRCSVLIKSHDAQIFPLIICYQCDSVSRLLCFTERLQARVSERLMGGRSLKVYCAALAGCEP